MNKIACIGAGPAGLLAAILLKKRFPDCGIDVYEKASPHAATGWGIVLPLISYQALHAADEECHTRLKQVCRSWDRIDIHVKTRMISSRGHDFISVERRALLGILETRAAALGVGLHYDREIADLNGMRKGPQAPDLIIVADGAGSRSRAALSGDLGVEERQGKSLFLWLGTSRKTDAFHFVFAETQWGWFQAHAFPISETLSSFIVETTIDAWRQAGLADMPPAETVQFCEMLFAEWLDGVPLRLQAAAMPAGGAWTPWRRFAHISTQRLVSGNTVFLGDAAHAVHFSVGAGTRLAIEDAVALDDAVSRHRDSVTAALAEYETERSTSAARLRSAARNSTDWFENVALHAGQPLEQFVYGLLTRSQRLGHKELQRRDPDFIGRYEAWLSGPGASSCPPPMFLPFALREMTLANRIVVSPMAMYAAEDGCIDAFHLVHFGARALGGAGLILTEMTAVSPDARITRHCAGMYRSEHVAAWRRLTEFVHRHSDARICLQLGHAGSKGSTELPWIGENQPMTEGGWPLLGPSAIAWGPGLPVPRAMDEADREAVLHDFVAATRLAIEAGFDMIELHAAHGYLLSAFLTPLLNRREDRYGGSLVNRLRYPIEVFQAMRAVWPASRPMSVRISAHDWADGGIAPDDAVEIARAFKQAGADLIDVSAGQTSPEARPLYGRMFQTPFSDRIRNEVGIVTMAVGNIFEADHVNTIIAAGRADLCALGRQHLADPHFTLRAAAEQGFSAQNWPLPYRAAKEPFEKRLSAAAPMAGF